MQGSLVSEQQPSTYTTDKSRITFIMGLLSGNALAWATDVWEGQSAASSSYVHFVSEMRKVFDHPVRGKDAARHLLHIRQGTRSVVEFSVEFRTLAAHSGWNDYSLQGVFYNGLSEAIKDELAARDDTNSLDSLISLSIKIDNCLRERRRDRVSRPQPCSTYRHSSPPAHEEQPQQPSCQCCHLCSPR